MSFVLGQIQTSPLAAAPTRVLAADTALEPLASNPAVLAQVIGQLDAPFSSDEPEHGGVAAIADECWWRHGLFSGPSGGGKTKAIQAVLSHLWAAGWSGLALETKWSSVRDYVAIARRAGIPASRLYIFSPELSGAMPRWPLFGTGLTPKVEASRFVDLIEAASGAAPRPRMRDLLSIVTLLVLQAVPDPSVDEVMAALQDPAYRDALVARRPEDADPFLWRHVEQFIRQELGRWSRSELVEAVSVVTRLLRELVLSPALYGAFSARREGGRALDLESLWREQGLVLLHFDPDLLGGYGSLLLAGHVVSSLFAAAKRVAPEERRTRVAACLDELPEISRFVGADVERILSQARSQGLHLLLAWQLGSQLRTSLVQSAEKQCAVQLYFRTDFQEARALAASLVAGIRPPLASVTVAPAARAGKDGPPTTAVRFPILDDSGSPLAFRTQAWRSLRERFAAQGVGLGELYRLARRSGIRHLFVREPGSGRAAELGDLVARLAPCRWRLEGPRVELVAQAPRVVVARTVRRTESELAGAVTECLHSLPNRTALLRVDNRLRGVVRIRDVPDLPFGPADRAYLAAALRTNGQTAEEITGTMRWRAERIAATASGRGAPTTAGGNGGVDDGSGW